MTSLTKNSKIVKSRKKSTRVSLATKKINEGRYFGAHLMKNPCEFCIIASGKKKAHVIWEDKNVLAFLDYDPNSNGHCIIIPKSHIVDLFELKSTIGSQILTTAKKIGKAIQAIFHYDGVEIRSVTGKFQDIPHFHLHVFGRSQKKDIQITYPVNIPSDSHTLSLNASKIIKSIKKQ